MTRTLLLLMAAVVVTAAAPVAAGSPPAAPPPCDAELEVCDVIDASTGKPRVWPKDVNTFQADVETCIHFAGEEPFDAARRRQINAAISKHCGGARRALPKLRGKYTADPLVLGRVNTIQALYDSAL